MNDVKSGEVHICCDWSVARPACDSMEDLQTFYIVSLFIDRCQGLAGVKSGETSINPKCKIKLEDATVIEKYYTLPKNKTGNPVFEEGFLFTSNHPNKERIVVEVIDVKGIDTSLGSVTIPISYLINSEQKEDINRCWTLDGGHIDATIFLSMKLYTV